MIDFYLPIFTFQSGKHQLLFLKSNPPPHTHTPRTVTADFFPGLDFPGLASPAGSAHFSSASLFPASETHPRDGAHFGRSAARKTRVQPVYFHVGARVATLRVSTLQGPSFPQAMWQLRAKPIQTLERRGPLLAFA